MLPRRVEVYIHTSDVLDQIHYTTVCRLEPRADLLWWLIFSTVIRFNTFGPSFGGILRRRSRHGAQRLARQGAKRPIAPKGPRPSATANPERGYASRNRNHNCPGLYVYVYVYKGSFIYT